MYSQRQQNKSDNIHLVLFEMPERNKSSTLKKHTHTQHKHFAGFIIFFFLYQTWNDFWKGKKKRLLWNFYFSKIAILN